MCPGLGHYAPATPVVLDIGSQYPPPPTPCAAHRLDGRVGEEVIEVEVVALQPAVQGAAHGLCAGGVRAGCGGRRASDGGGAASPGVYSREPGEQRPGSREEEESEKSRSRLGAKSTVDARATQQAPIFARRWACVKATAGFTLFPAAGESPSLCSAWPAGQTRPGRHRVCVAWACAGCWLAGRPAPPGLRRPATPPHSHRG